MSRYIKLDGIDNIKKEIFMPDDYAIGWNEAIDRIKEIPTADVEEVVRCKDCKYCDKIDDYDLLCRGHGMPYRLTTADDYCSHGKRREEN